jgi:Na+/H+ antiporter NhaD/arsenite permease-like protein
LLIGSLFVVTSAFSAQPLAGDAVNFLLAQGWSPDHLGQLVPIALLASNTIGNVPMVVLLVEMLPDLSASTLSMLAVFSTLAGNLLLIGSLANLIVAERAAESQVRLGFADFARVGIPITLGSTVVAMLWFAGVGYAW